jgi:hypothetical protein
MTPSKEKIGNARIEISKTLGSKTGDLIDNSQGID